jgi:hypothetical protein
MIRKYVFAFIPIMLFSSFIAAVDVSSNTLTSAVPAAVTLSAAPSNNAIGIYMAVIGRAIPGISYTRVVDAHSYWSVFGGAIYAKDVFIFLLEADAYYLLNDYFYAGLGLSGTRDEDGSFIFGLANPSAGLTSFLSENINFYIETTVLILTYRSKAGIDSNISVDNPVPILKLGVNYFFR